MRRIGDLAAGLLLAAVTAAFQQPPSTTAAPTTPRTYAECLRSYAGRTNGTAICQRMFPNAATANPSSTTAPASTDTSTPTREPVDITPQLNKLIDAWRNRPRTPPATPTDPLAVVPDIQAKCAAYAGVLERWRRCVADEWKTAGLSGQPPLVLQNPPVVTPPPVQPPVYTPPPVQPPAYTPPVVQSKPPVQTPSPLTPQTVEPEPVTPAPVVVPDPPPAAIVPPTPPPAVVPPPAPQPPPTPIWFWLLALAAAGGVGFGAARLLNRARASRPSKVAAAPCPRIALVPDPGVVALTPDGPPRAGLAVSLRFERAAADDMISLDYPTLETAP